MSRVVIVSNRVGDLSQPTQTGGLAVAVADALRDSGGVWFGWSGKTSGDDSSIGPEIDQQGEVTRIGVPLPAAEYEAYYAGYSNSVLWPLFHYRLDLVAYQPDFFDAYMQVNERFARALTPHLRPEDLIFVQDYHLIPFASALKRKGTRQRVGFFLHIPFPPPDILTASPNHLEIVKALLDYDVVGFQTQADAANFRRYVRENGLGEEVSEIEIAVDGRTVHVDRFPIGIDVDAFRAMALDASEDVTVDRMRRELLDQKQIIGVDRLDYTKGIPARFQAFEALLQNHPELERSVSLLQVAPPTREGIEAYDAIRAETEGMAGAINGRFAEIDWTPIRYIHRPIARDRLAALFRSSHVGLVTPLRDGMNLVAKEYVAAQDPENPGVLVLSQFAGAAEQMTDALIVNPHDVHEMGESLHRALTMPLAERLQRHASLLACIRQNDVGEWARSFLHALAPEQASAPPRADAA